MCEERHLCKFSEVLTIEQGWFDGLEAQVF